MKKTLRPYQRNAVDFCLAMLEQHKRPLINAAVSAGKSLMMCAVAKEFLQKMDIEHPEKKHKVLFLIDKFEIHDQNISEWRSYAPEYTTTEIISSDKSLVLGRAVFAMVQTIEKLIDRIPQFDLIIADEAHHSEAATWKKIVDIQRNALLFGVSGTPYRGDSRPLDFDGHIDITYQDLLDIGYIVRPTFIDKTLWVPAPDKFYGWTNECRAPDDIEYTPSKFGSIPYTIKRMHNPLTLFAEQKIKEITNSIACAEKEHGKTVVFAPDREIGKKLSESLKCYYVDGLMPAPDRANVLNKFKNCKNGIIINVEILTEGWNCPSVRVIVDLDENGTRRAWVQKIGRGCRLDNEKKNFYVYDFAGNIRKWGKLDHPADIERSITKEECEDIQLKKPESLGIGSSHRNKNAYEYDNEAAKKIDSNVPFYTKLARFEKFLDPYTQKNMVAVFCCKLFDVIFYKLDTDIIVATTDKNTITRCVHYTDEVLAIHTAQEYANFSTEPQNVRPAMRAQIERIGLNYPTIGIDRDRANAFICFDNFRNKILK